MGCQQGLVMVVDQYQLSRRLFGHFWLSGRCIYNYAAMEDDATSA